MPEPAPYPLPQADQDADPPFRGLPAEAIRVLQISDTHLFADPGGTLLGMNTRRALDAVVDLVAAEALPADVALATGDLVHDGSAAGYRALRDRLGTLGCPTLALPGNHDDRVRLAEVLGSPPAERSREARFADWQILLLDSTIPGSDGGMLAPRELEWLDQALGRGGGHALVCLHHSPLPTGSEWLDTMALANADDFFALVDRHPRVRGVLFGHIHQTLEAERNGVRIMGSPSTCVQFAKVRPRFGVDPQPPGYRWLGLLPDGSIRSGVRRVADPVGGLDLHAGGY
jgi:Icc protein